jgi:hypothetical protein
LDEWRRVCLAQLQETSIYQESSLSLAFVLFLSKGSAIDMPSVITALYAHASHLSNRSLEHGRTRRQVTLNMMHFQLVAKIDNYKLKSICQHRSWRLNTIVYYQQRSQFQRNNSKLSLTAQNLYQ